MNEDDTESNAPTFDIASLPSVHEHDWRNNNLDTKTIATVNLDGETEEDPYSDTYRAQEKEVNTKRSWQKQTPALKESPAKAMDTRNKQHVTFEGATTSPGEVVHINNMFEQHSSNNHTDSAQGPSDQSNNLPAYVPNKYSAHHDPSMPDWEGATIAERTMADISTLSPPPDDYYTPYAPPVAMIATTPGATWEELGESDAERANWRNPMYEKKEGSIVSGEPSALQSGDRKLIWSLIALVALLVVVVVIAVPVTLNTVKTQNESNLVVDGSNEDVVGSTFAPSSMPAAWGNTGGHTDSEDTDHVPGISEPKTTVPATTEPSANGRDTPEPTSNPIAHAPAITEDDTPNPSSPPVPVPAESTPAPTLEPISKPTQQPITPAPTTSSSESSLIQQNLGDRPKQWLEAHNERRQYYHESVYSVPYIPVVWSDSLASDSQTWADEQNDGQGCSTVTQDRDDIGQIGYAYWSTKSDEFDAPEDVVTWWFDAEADKEWDENKKFTQVLWRASKYLGCADSIKEFQQDGETAYCRIYVCSYIRKGNCNMNEYDDWTEPLLLDDTPCGNECPDEGCYWDAFNIERMFS